MIVRSESLAKPNAAVTVALCFLVAVLEGFDIQAIGVAAPRLAPQFGLSPGQMGWVFAVSNIGLVIGATLRRLARRSRRPQAGVHRRGRALRLVHAA